MSNQQKGPDPPTGSKLKKLNFSSAVQNNSSVPLKSATPVSSVNNSSSVGNSTKVEPVLAATSTIVEVPVTAIAKKFAIAAQITELLSQFSNKERRDILLLTSSQFGLKVVPVATIVAAGVTTAPAAKETSNLATKKKSNGKAAGVTKAKKQPRAAYKSTKEWVDLEGEHAFFVSALKEGKTSVLDDNDNVVDTIANRLKEVESEMKTVRSKLRDGKIPDSKKDVSSQ
jgi:hypothetical protein